MLVNSGDRLSSKIEVLHMPYKKRKQTLDNPSHSYTRLARQKKMFYQKNLAIEHGMREACDIEKNVKASEGRHS